jgi:hypothetical protein
MVQSVVQESMACGGEIGRGNDSMDGFDFLLPAVGRTCLLGRRMSDQHCLLTPGGVRYSTR